VGGFEQHRCKFMSISIIFSNAHLSNCPDYSTSAKVSQWLGMEFHTQILRPADLFSKIGNLILTKPSPREAATG
jgi:hypothetical protein